MGRIVEFFELATAFDLPPEEALAWFQAKGLRASFAWQDMLGDEHDIAFTVAKMMDTDLLQTVQGKLTEALAAGSTMAEFRRALIPTLQAAGWWGRRDVVDPATGQVVRAQLGSASRLETIFRTNLQSAYAVGHWQAIEANAEEAPYLLYDAVDDERTRPEHAAMDGTVLPVTDAWWRTHYPPNGWNCRCGVVQLSDADLAEYGLAVKPPPKAPLRPWKNPRTGETLVVPADLDPGWDHNPGMARAAQIKKAAQEKAQALEYVAQRAALKQAAQLQQAAQAAYVQELAAAQAQIDEYLGANTPYLAAAIKSIQATAAGKKMGPKQLLAAAKEKAAKAQAQAALADYKAAAIAGKAPSAKAQAAFDALAPELQQKMLASVEVKSGNAAAKQRLELLYSVIDTDQINPYLKRSILDTAQQSKFHTLAPVAQLQLIEQGAAALAADDLLKMVLKHPPDTVIGKQIQQLYNANPDAPKWARVDVVRQAVKKAEAELEEQAAKVVQSMAAGLHAPQAKLKQVALQKMQKAGALQGMSAQQIVEKVTAEAAQQQAKADLAALLSGYKKKIITGKVPSPKEQAAWASATPQQQQALLAKAELEKQQLLQQGAQQAVGDSLDDEIDIGSLLNDSEAAQAKLKEIETAYFAGTLDPATTQAVQQATELAAAVWSTLLPQEKLNMIQNLAAKVPAAKAVDAPPVHPSAVVPQPLRMANMVQTGKQKGSNKGGFYQDTTTGVRYYIKEPQNFEIAKNEVLASKLYAAAGVEVPQLTLWEEAGVTRIASRIIDGVKADRETLTAGPVPGAGDAFVVDAWLGNWDVVGLKYDNLLMVDGRAVRIDVGGSLRYRAQGELKPAFANEVEELQSLRSSKINSEAASVFQHVTEADLEAGARRVAAVTDAQIDSLVAEFGPAGAAARKKLAATLKARRDYIAQRLLQHEDLLRHPKYRQAYQQLTLEVQTAKTHLDDNLLTAIKGIASRASTKGLEQKDMDRAAEVFELYKALAAKAGAIASQASMAALMAHYEPYITALRAAIAPGIGQRTSWAGGQFAAAQFTIELRRGLITRAMLDAMPAYDPEAALKWASRYGQHTPALKEELRKKGLTEAEMAGLYAYTASGYRPMNAFLRGTGPDMPGMTDAIEACIIALQKLANRAAGIAVKRGVSAESIANFDAFRAAHTAQGTYVRWNAFTSTDTKEGWNGSVKFTINTARPHAYVDRYSASRGEKEVLLPPRTVLQVVSAEQRYGTWYIVLDEVLEAPVGATVLDFADAG